MVEKGINKGFSQFGDKIQDNNLYCLEELKKNLKKCEEN